MSNLGSDAHPREFGAAVAAGLFPSGISSIRNCEVLPSLLRMVAMANTVEGAIAPHHNASPPNVSGLRAIGPCARLLLFDKGHWLNVFCPIAEGKRSSRAVADDTLGELVCGS